MSSQPAATVTEPSRFRRGRRAEEDEPIYQWKRPADASKYGPLPKARYIVHDWKHNDKNHYLDMHSRAEHLVYSYMLSKVRTDANRMPAQPSIFNEPYSEISFVCGISKSTVARAIKKLIFKCTFEPWNVLANSAVQPKDGESATGRRKGEGGHRITKYRLLPWGEVLDRREKKFGCAVDPKTGSRRFYTRGCGRKPMDTAEREAWSVAERLAWEREQLAKKDQRTADKAIAAAEPPPIPPTPDEEHPRARVAHDDAGRAHTPKWISEFCKEYGIRRPSTVIAAWAFIDHMRACAAEVVPGLELQDDALLDLMRYQVALHRQRSESPIVDFVAYFRVAMPKLFATEKRAHLEWLASAKPEPIASPEYDAFVVWAEERGIPIDSDAEHLAALDRYDKYLDELKAKGKAKSGAGGAGP